jgi:bifunctional non-homologous end joining protein LigD
MKNLLESKRYFEGFCEGTLYCRYLTSAGLNLDLKIKIFLLIAKHKDSTYSPGDRTKQRLKIKTGKVVLAIIAGYLIDKDKSALSALIIAKKNEKRYEYLGLVSAGVGPKTVKKILTYGKRTTKSVFAVPSKVNRKGVFRTPIKNPEIVWIKPQFNCEVKFLELDFTGEMRHASFKGLLPY